MRPEGDKPVQFPGKTDCHPEERLEKLVGGGNEPKEKSHQRKEKGKKGDRK